MAPPAVMLCKTPIGVISNSAGAPEIQAMSVQWASVCIQTGANSSAASNASHQSTEAAISRVLALNADWIEHALEIGGVSYLRTPEEELSWIVLNNLDVYAAFAAAAAAALLALVLTFRRPHRSLPQAQSAMPNSSKKAL